MDSTIAFLISSILSDNAARAEVFGNSLTLSRPAAVKTGTTDDYRDSLTIGYTPSLVVGVWLGNNDNTPMSRVAGSSGAAPIWRLLMERFLSGTPVERFQRPLGIVSETVCRSRGLKVNFATSSAYTEYFLAGTLPTENCDIPRPTEEVTPTPEPEATATPEPTEVPEQPTQTPVIPTQPVVEPTDAPESTPVVVAPTI